MASYDEIVNSMTEDIKGIREAVLGKDVRENIASGMENTLEIYKQLDTAVESAASSADAAKTAITEVIDPTLSVSGKAADAAKVGEVKGELIGNENQIASLVANDIYDISKATLIYKNKPYTNVNGNAILIKANGSATNGIHVIFAVPSYKTYKLMYNKPVGVEVTSGVMVSNNIPTEFSSNNVGKSNTAYTLNYQYIIASFLIKSSQTEEIKITNIRLLEQTVVDVKTYESSKEDLNYILSINSKFPTNRYKLEDSQKIVRSYEKECVISEDSIYIPSMGANDGIVVIFEAKESHDYRLTYTADIEPSAIGLAFIDELPDKYLSSLLGNSVAGNAKNHKYVAIGILVTPTGKSTTISQIRLWESQNKYDSESVKSYWLKEITNKGEKVLQKKNEIGWNNLHFYVFSDYHTESNAGGLASIMRRLMDIDGCNMIVNNGDLVTIQDATLNNGIPDLTIRDSVLKLKDAVNEFSQLKNNIFNVVGNHDWLNYYMSTNSGYDHNECLTGNELTDILNNHNLLFVKNLSSDGSYFFDNQNKKVRMIFFGVGCNTAYTTTELKWFFDALDSTPDGFSALIFMHSLIRYNITPTDKPYYPDDAESKLFPYKIEDGDRFRRIIVALDSFAKNKDITIGAGWTNKSDATSYQWSNYNRTLIGVICGHTHYDVLTYASVKDNVVVYNDSKKDGFFPIICITGDLLDVYPYVSNSRLPVSKGEYDAAEKSKRGEDAIGTIQEHAFDDVVVDLDKKTMYFYRIGAGTDAVVSY